MSLETLDQPEHTDLDLDYCQIRRPRNIGPGFLKKHSYHAGIGWIGVGGDGWVSLEIRETLVQINIKDLLICFFFVERVVMREI